MSCLIPLYDRMCVLDALAPGVSYDLLLPIGSLFSELSRAFDSSTSWVPSYRLLLYSLCVCICCFRTLGSTGKHMSISKSWKRPLLLAATLAL